MATTYDEILTKNVQAFRVRAGLNHAQLAGRMKELGYSWNRATVSKIERGERSFRAAELLGLAVCLQTSVVRLMSPLTEDKQVEFPAGQSLGVAAVEGYVTGEWVTDERILWAGDKPVRNPGRLPAEES